MLASLLLESARVADEGAIDMFARSKPLLDCTKLRSICNATSYICLLWLLVLSLLVLADTICCCYAFIEGDLVMAEHGPAIMAGCISTPLQ